MPKIAASVAEWLLIGVVVLVLLIAAGAIEAAGESYPEDEFPWWEQGRHWSKFTAEDEARNFANMACNTYGMQRDVSLDQMGGGPSTLSCGPEPWMNCYIATLHFWCEDRPPSYAKQWIGQVAGPWNCNPGEALRKAATEANKQCGLQLRPTGSWFLGHYEISGVGQIGSGECGSGSWGPNQSYRYTLLPQCWRDMNQD